MRPALSFNEARHVDSFLKNAEVIVQESEKYNKAQSEQLWSAIQRIRDNPSAYWALEVVTETYARSMPTDWNWWCHQVSILLLGIVGYMDQTDALSPLVVNVPTAGGKTEAFTALALWTVAYEAKLPDNRLGISILKYPTTMLSDDQAGRLARYVMAFDQVMGERLTEYRPRGLGLFFGRDEDDADPRKRIGESCPWIGCNSLWKSVEKLPYGQGQRFTCAQGHSLTVAIHDEIFYLRPALVVSTLHKFVAKASKGLMAPLLGAPGYWCGHDKKFTNRSYCFVNGEKQKHEFTKSRTLITLLVLDEAHLIREGSGSLASHFETYYLELAKLLGGRYPYTLISTATIAHVRNHVRQLGLGEQPLIFPSEDGKGSESFYYEETDQINHVILACMPRGRAIAWAMPHLVYDYMDNAEKDAHFKAFTPAMIYCPSYLTRDQVRDGIQRHVNERRKNNVPPRSALEMDEFSRERFSKEGQDIVLSRINDVQVILSTNIASVGVDLGELRSILYFGIPSSVSEFIQSLNRVARRPGQPGVSILLLDPYKERDNSYYAYLEPFLLYPHRLVEAIPLNRFARKSIEETFDTIAMGLVSHYWTPMIKVLDIRRPSNFKAAHAKFLHDNEAIDLLDRIYRANEDRSNAYPGRVANLWSALTKRIEAYLPRGRKGADYPFGDNWIWYAGGIRHIWNLIPDTPQGEISLSEEASALQKASIHAVYGHDRTEVGVLEDEEYGLVLGASEDKDLGVKAGDE